MANLYQESTAHLKLGRHITISEGGYAIETFIGEKLTNVRLLCQGKFTREKLVDLLLL